MAGTVLTNPADIRMAWRLMDTKLRKVFRLGVQRVMISIESEALKNIRQSRKSGPGARATGQGATLAQSLSNNTTGVRWVKDYPVEITGRIGTRLDYGAYLEFGTGLYGPKHRVIRPTSKKALFWIWPAGSAKVAGVSASGRKTKHTVRTFAWQYAKYVRGVRPWKWLSKAHAAVRPKTISFFKQAAKEVGFR